MIVATDRSGTSAFLPAVVVFLVLCQGCASPDAADDRRPQTAAVDASCLVYVGTSTGEPSEGIHAFRFDPSTGDIDSLGLAATALNPSFLAASPDERTLYAVSERSDGGSLLAYRIERATGALELLAERDTRGAGPAYVGVNQTGRWIAVANYGGGSVSLFPVDSLGVPGAATDTAVHDGSGPNAERQEAPHAHYAGFGPGDRFVYAADLGTDEVRIYDIDREAGRWRPAGTFEAAPGAGPRHLSFTGNRAYLVNELHGTLRVLAVDPDDGMLSEIETVSLLPSGFNGSNKSADVHVHPSGRRVYASNRGDFDSIAVFDIDPATDAVSLAGHITEGIEWPRHFAFDTSGRLLFVANRTANEVRILELGAETGLVNSHVGRIGVPEPTNVTVLGASAR